jgi:hypothetical protein
MFSIFFDIFTIICSFSFLGNLILWEYVQFEGKKDIVTKYLINNHVKLLNYIFDEHQVLSQHFGTITNICQKKMPHEVFQQKFEIQ